MNRKARMWNVEPPLDCLLTATCASDRLPSPPIAGMRRAATSVLSMSGTDAVRPRYRSRLLAALDAQARDEPPPPPPTTLTASAARPHPTLGETHDGGRVARTRSSPARTHADLRPYVFCSARDRRLTRAQAGARED
jgi:hypothetical protein